MGIFLPEKEQADEKESASADGRAQSYVRFCAQWTYGPQWQSPEKSNVASSVGWYKTRQHPLAF